MTKERFAKVLERMLEDHDYGERIAEGDFAELDEDELTGAERALLEAAAGEVFSEVSGFAQWISPSDYKGISGPFHTGLGPIDISKIPAPPAPAKLTTALEYTGIYKF